MTSRSIELRSDTFTRPTESMRRAMYRAEVGDDVWGEDPTVRRLETRAAQLTGKEAAVFVSSGTQGNLIGVLAHCERGDEFIVGDEAHIIHYEMGGTAIVGGLQVRAIRNRGGHLDADEIGAAIRVDDGHSPRTGCLAIENTHNRCGGAVLDVSEVETIAGVAHRAQIPVHMDGARVFNAATSLARPVVDVVATVDSVAFCLSKGLGSPVGSLLCGTRDFIRSARRWRQILGGGMRQAGILAAAGLVALDENVERLRDDHENARSLAIGLANIAGIGIDPGTVDSNIVIFDVSALGTTPAEFSASLLTFGVKVAPAGPSTVRAVTSYEVSAADIETALHAMNRVSGAVSFASV